MNPENLGAYYESILDYDCTLSAKFRNSRYFGGGATSGEFSLEENKGIYKK